MKKIIFILPVLIFSLFSAFSQPQPKFKEEGKGKEKVKALYIAFMTQELSLNESEAQKFWPIHEQFTSEIKAVHKDKMATELGREESTLIIKKKYNDKFSKILGSERTDLFFKKDKEFRGKMVDNLKKKRMDKQNNNKDRKPF